MKVTVDDLLPMKHASSRLLAKMLYRTEYTKIAPHRGVYILQPRPWARIILRLPRNETPST
jgi:hypothetical protein